MLVREMQDLINKIFNSYEERVRTVERVLKNILDILINFHKEQEEMIYNLREALAKKIDLRKKDFDLIMKEVVNFRREKENEVLESLQNFLKEEKRFIKSLKQEVFNEEKRDLLDVTKLREKIFAAQSEMERKIAEKFREFQTQEEMLSLTLKKLLEKSDSLKAKELKNSLTIFEAKSSKRKNEVEKVFHDLELLREKVFGNWKGLRVVLETTGSANTNLRSIE